MFIPLVSPEHGAERLIQSLQVCLAANPIPFDVFLLAQSDTHLRNLGALLNAGAKLLNGTLYDHFCWLTERFICPSYAVSRCATACYAQQGLSGYADFLHLNLSSLRSVI